MSDESMLRRQRTVRIEAVVLRHSNWGEADRFLSLFTLEMGKIRAIAKGVRKPHSRKAGHLEPFTQVSLLLARGRDIPIITQAETVEPYLILKEDLAAATYAFYVVELVDRFTFEEGANRGLYSLLVKTLSRLTQSVERDLIVHYFEIHLLDLVGFRPQLFNCTNCGAEIIAQDQYFSAATGGVLCPGCGKQNSSALPISMNALKYMRYFQRSSYADVERIRLEDGINREMELVIQHYLGYLLESHLNTPPFLRRLRRDKSI